MLNGEVVGGTDSDGELRHDFRLFQRSQIDAAVRASTTQFYHDRQTGTRIVAEEPKRGGRGPSASSCAMICNAETVPQRVSPIIRDGSQAAQVEAERSGPSARRIWLQRL